MQLREMVDAIRQILGKDPLYNLGTGMTTEERCRIDEMTLPYSAQRTDEWFRAGAGMPEETDDRRARTIEFAVRKLTSAPPLLSMGRQVPRHKWKPRAEFDKSMPASSDHPACRDAFHARERKRA
jgi:hypothetical protein